MGTIADKLDRVLKTKKDIQSALVKNGKYVPDKLPFKYYPYLIDNMNIDGLVGMYYGKGLTNEELSKDPTWYDTSGNGNDLKFKNLAWKLNSGAGIYVYDFTRWNYNIGGLTSVERTGSKIQFKAPSNALTGNVYDEIRNIGYNYNFKIRVTGLKFGNKFSIRKGTSSILMNITQDGIYHVNTIVEEDWDQKTLYIFINSIGGPDVDLIVEQIPDYEGAICFNGIDDCAVCDNFPILTKEKGYTAMALRKWINKKNAYDGLISNKNAWSNGCAFIVEYSDGIKDGTISFGRNTYVDYSQDFLVYQTSQNYNGNQILTGDDTEGTTVLNLGRLASSGFSQYSNFAIYALCVIDHDTSDAERQIVINKWKQYYPELFPDQAWTVTGKTNEDEDRATVKNLTGNGNNLVLSNFAFAEDSGYGLYQQNFNKEQWIIATPSRVEATKTNSSFNVTEVKATSIQLYYLSKQEEVAFTVTSTKVRVVGLTDGQSVNYRYFIDGVANDFLISSDGIYDLPEFEFPAKGDYYGFNFTKVQSSCNITIEQIPDYQGYLVTDGVDDKI